MKLSVVIPVADDSSNKFLVRLLNSLRNQTLQDFEVILIVGDTRQGRAINHGVSAARGKWIVTMDDDTEIGDPSLLENLVLGMKADPSIGMGGAACVVPESASRFQTAAMNQIPRRLFPEQVVTVDSDFVQHPCLIISRDLFLRIGGEDEELIRGLDPVLRKKVRDSGKRVAILANTAVGHLLPDSFWRVCAMYRRNGRGSAFAQRHFPDRVLELTTGYDCGEFIEKRSLPYRIARKLLQQIWNFVTLNWIRLSAEIAYGIGWVETFFSKESLKNGTAPTYQETPVDYDGNFPVRRIRVTN